MATSTNILWMITTDKLQFRDYSLQTSFFNSLKSDIILIMADNEDIPNTHRIQ